MILNPSKGDSDSQWTFHEYGSPTSILLVEFMGIYLEHRNR
jgi:hypothetical protein